jgi:hypothetical protein
MPTVQSYYFTKNGSAEWGNCNVSSSDEIGAEAIVTFSGSEYGSRFYCQWVIRTPQGTDLFPFSQYVYATEVTATFVNEQPFTGFITGTYTITRVDVIQG